MSDVVPCMTPDQVLDAARRSVSIRWLDGTFEKLSIGPQDVVIATNIKTGVPHRMALHAIYYCVEQQPISLVPTKASK